MGFSARLIKPKNAPFGCAKQIGTCVTVLTAEDICGEKCERLCASGKLAGDYRVILSISCSVYMQKCTLTCASPLALRGKVV